MTDIVTIRSTRLSAEINPLGAELHAVRDADQRDLLWDGDPAIWSGRAPVLFPVIGVVNDGHIRVGGKAYPMAKHGFARRRKWAIAAQDDAAVTFRLEDDAETRASYPFAFRLDLTFAIEEAALALTATLTNPADMPLPASFGFHPALRWPLPYGAPRAEHRMTFDEPESAPIRRIDPDGLLRPEPQPTPVDGRALVLRDALFDDDALIFDAHTSRGLTYGAPGFAGLRIDFPAMPELGIWTKPGAPYICVEPWAGIADPEGFAGEFADKPGVISVAPRGARTFAMRIALAQAQP
jgi:galactose mutarotase-like enzyme